MKNTNNTLITAIQSVIDSNEFNNDFTTAQIFKKYTDKGALLITGLVGETDIPTELNVSTKRLKPYRLTATVDFDILNETELMYKITQQVNKEFETKYNKELSSNESLIIGVWQMDLIADDITLKDENKVRLIINTYIDVVTK